ncbi:MAG: hypothetical protein KGJ13_05700 [Patescibacteria group bacterium]|nr:hypothetical protein [Patescibacteria group bacterium]
MNVRIDSKGYAYNAETGNYLTIWYDEDGNAYDADTGEFIDSLEFDTNGQTVYRGGNGWNQTLQTIATGVLVPRNQYPYSSTPGQYPRQNIGNNLFPGSVNTQGFQINWWMAALGGLFIGAFFLGKKGR